MCNPIALGIASTVVATAGAVTSGIGQAQQYRYQAQIADQNARLAKSRRAIRSRPLIWRPSAAIGPSPR